MAAPPRRLIVCRRAATSLLLSAGLLPADRALACAEHADQASPALDSLSGLWSWDPVGISILLLCAVVYPTGVARLWRNAGFGHGLRPRECAAYALGWAAVAAALLSPLDSLSDALFAAHMTQHELLMLVAAPAMVIGRPWIALCWALPERVRQRLLRRARDPRLQPLWRALSAPLPVLVLHAVVLWLWHTPVLFDAALDDERIHALQHATFFGSSALFFFALTHGRYGRVGYGASALFVFVTAGHSGLLGALLTFAHEPWYPVQAARALALGSCPLDDQQLAGLLMWVPAGTILTLIGVALFAAWLGEAERRATLARRLAGEPQRQTIEPRERADVPTG